MKDPKQNHSDKFLNLVKIMATLRAPDGCPWDREQTHDSLKQYLIEEAYEVLEALEKEDDQHLKEEMGDLLLQVVFHARIAEERGAFGIDDVVEGISQKLVRRHPNVFGNVKIETAEEQSVNWEKIKKAEGKNSTIDGVPKALPALLRAKRIQQKASTTGFDWNDIKPVWQKVDEELAELKAACAAGNSDEIKDEFGDVLFSLVNLARFLDLNPEDALRATIEKFTDRFMQVEQHFMAKGQDLSEVSLQEMDNVWDAVKKKKA